MQIQYYKLKAIIDYCLFCTEEKTDKKINVRARGLYSKERYHHYYFTK